MDFLKKLHIYIERTNNTLRHFIRSNSFQHSLLLQIMEYGTLLGGKRLRPLLVYTTGNMFNVDNNLLDIPSAAIECIHAYSLMYDDLPSMDNDNLRRNLPSCHVKYGEANTILAGNSLQMLAFSILIDTPMIGISNYDRLQMVSELAKASGISGICRGQLLDIETARRTITIEELDRIYQYKTGSLIKAAVRLGALTAGDRGRQALPLLDRYAAYIGLAFQIQDDILDFTEDTGKSDNCQGTNKKFRKNSYPVLIGLEQSRYKAQNLIDNARQFLKQLAIQSLVDVSKLQEIADYIIQRDK